MTLSVDHESLEKISRSLAAAGADLDDASDSAPTSIDGGYGTPAILGIMAKLAHDTGQLVVAVKAVADAVALASNSYRDQDGATAEELRRAMGG